MLLRRPGIDWVGSGSALICFLAAVWRNSWGLRLVRSVLVLKYHFHPCIVSASIFFLDCPYRVVHLGFWFCIVPVGGWSAYSKSTNSCSCSSPCHLFRTPLFFQKITFVGIVFLYVLSVRDTFYSLLVILGHGAGSILNRWPPVWRTRIVCFKSNLLLNIQMYNKSLLHNYY